MKFVSLFAGIGGMDLGLERAGMQCVAQVEIDDYASKVLAKHWPDVVRFRDVRDVGTHNLPDCDLIAGGFPCQDISNAGKRAGIDGERSGLWSEFHRIIREVRPRYVLVENVAALLNRGIERVLGDLAASGYDAEWDCIPAAAVGAPHLRDRLFIVAYTNSARQAHHSQSNTRSQCDGGRHAVSAGGAENVADAARLGVERHRADWFIFPQAQAGQEILGRYRSGARRNFWPTEPGICGVANGIPCRVDRLKGLGNAVVPQVAEFIGRRIIEAELAARNERGAKLVAA